MLTSFDKSQILTIDDLLKFLKIYKVNKINRKDKMCFVKIIILMY